MRDFGVTGDRRLAINAEVADANELPLEPNVLIVSFLPAAAAAAGAAAADGDGGASNVPRRDTLPLIVPLPD
jgi:hypothetical protein